MGTMNNEFDAYLSIFDKNASRYIDVLQVALLRIGRCSILPELYEVFGQEKLLKFLDIFSGTTVEVPSRALLEHAVRDTYIYVSIRKVEYNGGARSEVIKTLARRYGISDDRVRSIYLEMKNYLDGLNIKVTPIEEKAGVSVNEGP
jgi:hypothetical protein